MLSKREEQILNLISFGFNTMEIAEILFLSRDTVNTHRKKIYRKLEIKNMAELIRKGFTLGYLSIEDRGIEIKSLSKVA